MTGRFQSPLIGVDLIYYLIDTELTRLTCLNLQKLKRGWGNNPLERNRKIRLELNPLSSWDNKAFQEELTDESGHLSVFWIMSQFFRLAEKHMGHEESARNPAVSVPFSILSVRGREAVPYKGRSFEGNLGIQLKQVQPLWVLCPLVSVPFLSTGMPQKAEGLVQQRLKLSGLRNPFCFLFLMCICLKFLTRQKCPTGHAFQVLIFEKGAFQERRAW